MSGPLGACDVWSTLSARTLYSDRSSVLGPIWSSSGHGPAGHVAVRSCDQVDDAPPFV